MARDTLPIAPVVLAVSGQMSRLLMTDLK